MLLARILQSQGFGSRRECISLVQTRRVTAHGQICTNPDAEFETSGLALTVDGEDWPFHEKVYLLLNKPAGYECSRLPSAHPSIFSLLPAPLIRRGVQCVGRLDQDTTGLLLFSDDGSFIHRLTSPKKQIGKTYRVGCKHPVNAGMIEALLTGVQLRDEPSLIAARACTQSAEAELILTINEGKYHQVKRMVAAAGNRVETLERTAVGDYVLPAGLGLGCWRWLGPDDLALLG